MPQNPLTRPMLQAAAILLALFCALAVAWIGGSSTWINIIARLAITSIATLSLSFIIGQAGLVSFGHAALVGIGAYTALILGEYGISDISLVLGAAFGVAALLSALTGTIALRTQGVYFIMLTLAMAQMAYFTMSSLSSFGGDDGMALATRSTLFGYRLFKTDLVLAACSILLLAILLAGFVWASHTRFGLILRAAKENPARVAASGFRILTFQRYAYALSGGVAAMSGVLLANQADFVSPSYMNWHRSGELIVMVVLGGVSSLPGAVIGTAAVLLIEELLGHYTEFWKLGLGLLIIAATLLRGSDLKSLLGAKLRG